jgi:hypothetical protein
MRVKKKAMAKTMLLLNSGYNDMKPKKKVGILFTRVNITYFEEFDTEKKLTSIAAHRQNICVHDLLMANSTIIIYREW